MHVSTPTEKHTAHMLSARLGLHRTAAAAAATADTRSFFQTKLLESSIICWQMDQPHSMLAHTNKTARNTLLFLYFCLVLCSMRNARQSRPASVVQATLQEHMQ